MDDEKTNVDGSVKSVSTIPVDKLLDLMADPDHSGPMQHLRTWTEIDAIMQSARAHIMALKAEVAEAKTWRDTVREIYDATHFNEPVSFPSPADAATMRAFIVGKHPDFFDASLKSSETHADSSYRVMTVKDALSMVEHIHAGQTDRTGDPYVNHLVAVMNLLPADIGDEIKIIALFHDAFEDRLHVLKGMAENWRPDSTVDEFLLAHGMTDYTLQGIKLITRDNSVSYMDYIRTVAKSDHLGAYLVKCADNHHNSDRSRADRILDEAERMAVHQMINTRYRRAEQILRDEAPRYGNHFLSARRTASSVSGPTTGSQ